MTDPNLVLIGYRGTGKSTIAALVGEQLKRPVFSTDEAIVSQAGQSIPEIVAERTWDGFRNIEEAVVAAAAARTGIILDCGGGVILRPANVAALKRNGFCVWLTAPLDTIAQRIGGDSNRPSLTGQTITDEIRGVLAEREPLYRAAADLIVDTGSCSAEQAAALIVRAFPSPSR